MAVTDTFKVFTVRGTWLHAVVCVLLWCPFMPSLIAQRHGCSIPLGMEDKRITDSQLRSLTHDSGWDAPEGRLNNKRRAWCSDDNEAKTEYFEVDLRKIRHVSSIATQGVRHLLISYFVRVFVIMYSYDGTSWFSYRDNRGAEKTFTGNSDANTQKINNFRSTFVTRYLRIFPLTYEKDMCLRVELYGCDDYKDDCSSFIKSLTGFISSPGYPTSYPSSVDCTWIISANHANAGKKLALLFLQFDVASGLDMQSCNTDYVYVQNGHSDHSSQIGGKFCNLYQQEKPMVITADANTVRIYFHSDGSSNTHKGFLLHYLPIAPGTGDVLTAAACDGDFLVLNCSNSVFSINIVYAFYGSYPYSCGQMFSNVTCEAPDANSTILRQCQELKICRISVNGHMFAHNCPPGPVRRRLEVFYQCTSKNIRTPPTHKGTTTPATTALSFTVKRKSSSHSVSGQASLPFSNTGVSTQPAFTNQPGTSSIKVALVSSTLSTSPNVGVSTTVGKGDKDARKVEGLPSGATAGVVVVVVFIILTGILVALVFVRKKRRRKEKGSTAPTVEFSPWRETPSPDSTVHQRCPVSSTGPSNAYETVNLLYDSTLPKLTENPLYESVSPPSAGCDGNGYELVTPQNTAAHEYESPQLNGPSKVESVNNPNYEKTLPFKNHDYALPEC